MATAEEMTGRDGHRSPALPRHWVAQIVADANAALYR
jgi:hypothetical protein